MTTNPAYGKTFCNGSKNSPFGLDYSHHHTGEDNGDAHLKRMVLGHQVIVPITHSTSALGSAFRYGEFDARRRKRIVMKVMGMAANI